MTQWESLISKLDESLHQGDDEEMLTVMSMVPWARESMNTYLENHRSDLEKEVLRRIEELLDSTG